MKTSIMRWNDIIYYVPNCNVRKVVCVVHQGVSATCMTLSTISPCLNEYKKIFGYSRNRFVHFALII